MRRIFGVVVFVVLVVLGSAIPADAQSLWRYLGICPPRDELCRVMVGNQQMVREMRTGYMGYYRGDGFYAAYDPYGRPLPRLVKIAVGAGIGASIGGGIGDLFGHGREGTLIGAGLGAILGSRQGSGNRNQPLVVQEGQQVRIASDGTPIAVGQPVGSQGRQGQGPVSNPPSTAGEWRVSNRTSKRAELWDGEQFIARIEPWQSVQVSAPESGYKAVLLIPNRSGGLDQETAQVRRNENFDGWDIVAPAVQ